LFSLYKYRDQITCLNHSLLLTHGNPGGFSSLASRLNITDESYTAVVPASDSQPPLIGQVQHTLGERSAHLTFVTPGLPEPHPGLLTLLDDLATHAGEMKAINILAEIDDADSSLETFRRSGFSTYCWESVWQLPAKVSKENPETFSWEPMSSLDEPAVRTLYQTLVPPLVQSAEPYTGIDVRRLVVRNNGELIAYVESDSGPHGIYLKPIFHPAAEDVPELLLDLVKIFQGLSKPVYLQMRSYQAWLTPLLETLNAENSIHFALMIRHLAVAQYSPAKVQQVRISQPQTETSATIVQKLVEPRK
jgi:hypothetical protein